ncbi:MAG: AMP-dependent synthetase [Rhodobacteraceae bacterium]|nr:MAG: AMP-dependent synthetase [Paracoccaceae bacterium]
MSRLLDALTLEDALPRGRDWASLRAGFRWPQPSRLNLAEALVGLRAEAEPDRLALRHLDAAGRATDWSFRALDRAACRLANGLAAHGVGRGDRVAVLLGQSPETLITHLATYRLGAVIVPLFTPFGEEALAFRLGDSAAAALVTDRANLPKIVAIRDRLPDLRLVLCADGPVEGAESLPDFLARGRDAHACAATSPDDPALIAYTSGTTGPPKGALHGHRVLLGHLPAARLAHDFAPRPGEVFWTPSDWAWMGGLCNLLMPALAWGAPVLSHRMEKFDPERAFRVMADHHVASAFLAPTALRLMRGAPAAARAGARLRTVGAAGESLGAELLDWGREALGLTIAEFYGQTECNKVLTNAPALFAPKPGSTGRPAPGADVAVIDSAGRPLPAGETGEIAVRRGHPSMFLGYWRRPDRTAEKFVGDWMRTGDEGRADGEGHFFFSSRADDVITSSGYRIGPSEIEDCLGGHPAVAMAAAVGLPDPLRGEIVAAFVVLRPGVEPAAALGDALAAHVRSRLGAHVAPRRVSFVDALPLTATGKIMRREIRRAALAQ